MAVAMVDVRIVRMGVDQWLMSVGVGMRLTRRLVGAVDMSVVLVMAVGVAV